MPTTHIADPSVKKLRLWPGVALVAMQWLLLFGVPAIAPDAELFELPIGLLAILGGVLCGLLIALWWLFFSRAHWAERVGAIMLMVAGIIATSYVVHVSIAGAGLGMLLYIAAIPGLSLALVVWAVATARLSTGVRRATLVVAILLACAPWTLLRTAGVIGSAGPEYHWRWTPTPEELLLAQADDTPDPIPLPPVQTQTPVAPVAVPAAPAAATVSPTVKGEAGAVRSEPEVAPAEWPGFRGPDRDGTVHGVRINTDWSSAPPVEMWRRPIGPGWSSFSVRGDLLYTQEQRGDDEIVSCYRVSTGEPVWRHRDAVRFWESNGGAGPRATPTLHGDRVYAFGATGILNALDAATGAVVWSGNVAADTGRAVPMWGFASSPLVVDDLVIVAAAGTLAAYDRATGSRRWTGPSYGGSYSSPHRATIDGVVQILLLGGPGAISVAPADGAVLWTHEWEPGPIIQPAVMADGDILVNAIAATGGIGTRRLHVTRGPGGPSASSGPGAWNIEERWTSNGLKPYFNDFVVHKGHAFGFDGSILSSINLNDGKRNWKGGRYGNGQLILLPDQDVMLVLSEEGELALVSATTGAFTELARFPALDGKTWNHPVLVGDVLLVRNGEEMAAFRLVLQGR
jgi:outer membrane protein assembly factor BamB